MSGAREPLSHTADRLRIVFAGTPDFAVPTLERLHARGCAIDLVLTQPDRPSGRGRKPAASPVKQAAKTLGLDIAQPERLTDSRLLEQWGAAPDLVVVVAYGLLLPAWMLRWPRLVCLNLHASLLPRWRGAAPIQHAILADDAQTGVCVMRMETGLDRGPVYAASRVAIAPRESAGDLHDRLAVLGADLLDEVLPRICDASLMPKPQDDALATFAPKIAKGDAVLDWRQSAARLERQVRAYDPWPVAEARAAGGLRLRIWEAEAVGGDPGGAPGTVIVATAAGIEIAAADGRLRVLRLQAPGAKVMDAAAYLAAHRIDGVRFGP